MFNIGDIVVCVNNFGHSETLTEGKQYEIVDGKGRVYATDKMSASIINDRGEFFLYYSYRFEHLTNNLQKEIW